MNSISWYIYFSEISDNIKFVLAIFCFLLFILMLFLLFLYSESNTKNEKFLVKKLNITFSVFVITAITLCFVPSQKIVLAIAASQTMELIVKSPEAEKMGSTLLNIIQKQLNEKNK